MKSEETLLVDAFVEWMDYSKQFYRDTKSLHRRIISRYFKWLPEDIETIGQLTDEHVEGYIQLLIEKHPPGTLRKYRECLEAFHHWLARQYEIPEVIEYNWQKSPFGETPVIKADGTENVLEEWLEYNRRFTIDTQKHYRSEITRFFQYAGIENVNQLSCKLIEQFISKMIGEGMASSTVNKILAVVKSFCKWLKRNYNTPNYARDIKELKQDPPEARFLSWEEYEKVLSVAEGQKADVIKFLANTGVRCSELCGLKWGNVSKDYKMLMVIGKGRKKRYVPLNCVCKEVLQKYERGQDDEYLNFTRRNRKSIYSICVNLAKQAGIPRAGVHSYRHLFATELLRRGIPISHVSKLLGHSSIAITERTYIHFMPDFLNGLTDVLTENN